MKTTHTDTDFLPPSAPRTRSIPGPRMRTHSQRTPSRPSTVVRTTSNCVEGDPTLARVLGRMLATSVGSVACAPAPFNPRSVSFERAGPSFRIPIDCLPYVFPMSDRHRYSPLASRTSDSTHRSGPPSIVQLSPLKTKRFLPSSCPWCTIC